jgi:hypothetical protein
MRTVWVFGDSFSVDFENNRIGNFELYKDLKGYYPKSWGKLISEELGYEYKNFAQGGWDNYSILQSFCENITEIKPNDLVFVGWAPEIRIRLMSENGQWMCFTGHLNDQDWEGIKSYDVSKLISNRIHLSNFSPKEGVLEEILSWENMIRFTMKEMKLHIWKWYNMYDRGYQTIQEESNGYIGDTHWSENGHKSYFKDLIKELNLTV